MSEWTVLSQASSHSTHTCNGFRGAGGCRGCRWFEVRISRQDTYTEFGELIYQYDVEMVGRSIVHGEEDRVRVETTTSPHAVIDYLTMGDPASRYIPKISRQSLHEAGDRDQGIADALDDFDSLVSR